MKNKLKKITAAIFILGGALCITGCGGNMSESRGSEDIRQANNVPYLEDIEDYDARIWRYSDDPLYNEQIKDNSWTEPGFDDTKWSQAKGSFGAKNGALNGFSTELLPDVCLRQYEPDGDNIPVYYFRLEFNAKAEDITLPLIGELVYDDAAVVYINGQKAASCNTPKEGYSSPYSYGCKEVCGDPCRESFIIDSSLLKEGKNVLAVELHQDNEDSSDIYFAMNSLRSTSLHISSPQENSLQRDTLCLGVGSDSRDMLVTWQGAVCDKPCVRVKHKDSNTKVYDAQKIYVDEEKGICTYRALLTELASGSYTYSVEDKTVSDIFTFNIPNEKEGFSFLCSGDPQITDEEDISTIDSYEFLGESIMGDTAPRFILTLGDQSDDGDEAELFRRYTSIPLFKSIPLAAIVGNHERNSELFSRFFYMPNMDRQTEGKAGDMSCDYWFYRNNTLFLCLNSNNTDVAIHERFMTNAVNSCKAQYGEPVWIAAALHFSFFSEGDHANDDKITEGREKYAEAFKRVGVDVVFSGHDHSYTRSYPMDGAKPLKEGEKGVVYFSLGSSTGSKLYDLIDEKFDYAAFADDGKYPQMTRVDVTDNTMTVTTYKERRGRTEILDTYIIDKKYSNRSLG